MELTEFGRGLIIGLVLGSLIGGLIAAMAMACMHVAKVSDEQDERMMRQEEIKHDKATLKKRIAKAMMEGEV